MTIRKVTLPEFLTAEEIERAVELYAQLMGTGRFAKAVHKEIIQPNMDRINAALGQDNNGMYLAYCVEAIMVSAGWRGDA